MVTPSTPMRTERMAAQEPDWLTFGQVAHLGTVTATAPQRTCTRPAARISLQKSDIGRNRQEHGLPPANMPDLRCSRLQGLSRQRIPMPHWVCVLAPPRSPRRVRRACHGCCPVLDDSWPLSCTWHDIKPKIAAWQSILFKTLYPRGFNESKRGHRSQVQ